MALQRYRESSLSTMSLLDLTWSLKGNIFVGHRAWCVSRVAANAYFAQASLPKAETSALRIPCSKYVSLRLSGTKRICFKDCITLSLLDLSAWLLICNLLKSYYVLWSLKTVSQNFANSVFSGPDVSANSSLCTTHRILSNVWCRNVSINTFNSILASLWSWTHAPITTQCLMLLYQTLTLAHGLQDATAVPWQTWLLLAPVVLVIKPKSRLHHYIWFRYS